MSPLSPVRLQPGSRYPVPAFPNLSDPEERRRLSASALRAFFNIVRRWELRDEDARMLLGGISNGAYYQLKQSASKTQDQDRLLRISYLIGIYKALHILYGSRLANRWVSLPNVNPVFSGRSPLQYMVEGAAPAMQVVRRLLDARRG